MITAKHDSDFQGYSDQVRVNYHVDSLGKAVSESSKVKFSCRHKYHPDLEVIMSLSVGELNSASLPSILTIESLCVIDPEHKLSQLADEVLQRLLSSILLATFEYSKSHSIKEWLIPVKPAFEEELTEIGVSHQKYSFDTKGRCVIGVLPAEFLSKGHQLIDSWTRRIFECKPLLN